MIRIGLAAPGAFQARGVQVTAVAGAVGAAAAAGRLKRLDQAEMASAIGIAGAQASGLLAFLEDGATAKALNPGWAAHTGITAAGLARAGMTGPRAVLESPFGVMQTFAGGIGTLPERLADLGTRWHLSDAAFKLYPCCHYIHPFLEALEALETLMADGLSAPDVEHITAHVAVEQAPLICTPWPRRQAPVSGHDGKWGLGYCLALMLADGAVDVASFEVAPREAVVKIARRIDWQAVTGSGFPGVFPARLGVNHHFEFCSALVFLCFQKGWTHGNFSIVQSVAGACYHMMLSAHLRGFQWIWNAGIGDPAAVREMLALPATFDVQGALAIGRAKPTAPAMKAPRRPVSEVFSWGSFARPGRSVYPVKPAPAYPFFDIRNDSNPFAQWDPNASTWDQIADFRGYSVWAKSPLAGVYVSRRQGEAQAHEHGLLPDPLRGTIVEVMGWGGTSTVGLCERLAPGARLHVAELSDNNLSFIRERLRREGFGKASIEFDLLEAGRLSYGDGTVDTVVLPQVLEHVPDPQAMLDEVRRVLAPGGSVVVSARNMASPYGALWRETEAKAQVPNQGPFTPLAASDLRDWLSARFGIEAETGIGRDATGDATLLGGADLLAGRLYAARARRD